MPDSATACSVTYIETLAAVADDARRILEDYARERASARGLVAIDLLQRPTDTGQFVLVETGSLAAVGDAASIAARDGALAPLLLAPSDVRSHAGLAIAPLASGTPAAALWVVTHVDVVPANKETGVARVLRHAETSRRSPGCLRFEAWQQVDRPNHMTLVEVWRNAASHDDHRTADDTRGYRDLLAALSGALYDERIYRRIAP